MGKNYDFFFVKLQQNGHNLRRTEVLIIHQKGLTKTKVKLQQTS